MTPTFFRRNRLRFQRDTMDIDEFATKPARQTEHGNPDEREDKWELCAGLVTGAEPQIEAK